MKSEMKRVEAQTGICPLPWDYFRCKPEEPVSICRACKRWADQPWQTWGPRTPIMALKPDSCGTEFIGVKDE